MPIEIPERPENPCILHNNGAIYEVLHGSQSLRIVKRGPASFYGVGYTFPNAAICGIVENGGSSQYLTLLDCDLKWRRAWEGTATWLHNGRIYRARG